MTNAGNPEKHNAGAGTSTNGSDGESSDQQYVNEQDGGQNDSVLSSSDNGAASLLDKKVQDLETQLKEKEARYVYLYADFENYKKRAIRERSDLIKFGWESVARELLEVMDNLERAMAHVPAGTDKNFVAGIRMTLDQFGDTLQKQGVKTIESLKQNFDPNLHESVGQEASKDPEGTIVKEHTRGYTLHGRLLRPARVVLSDGKGAS